MAHFAKWKTSNIDMLFRHCERTNKNFSNEKINEKLTKNNWTITNKDNVFDALNERISNANESRKMRENITVCCSWVITKPKDLKDEDEQKFFCIAHTFISERYGKDNVLKSYIHKDETTPHAHIFFTPIDKEKGNFNCNKVVSRKDLKTFHKDLSKYMEKHLGYKISIENGLTIKKSNGKALDVKELKKRNEELKINLSEEEKINQVLEEKLSQLKAYGKNLEDEFLEQKNYIDYMKKEYIDNVNKTYELKDLESKYIHLKKFADEIENKMLLINQSNYENKKTNEVISKGFGKNKSYFVVVPKDEYDKLTDENLQKEKLTDLRVFSSCISSFKDDKIDNYVSKERLKKLKVQDENNKLLQDNKDLAFKNKDLTILRDKKDDEIKNLKSFMNSFVLGDNKTILDKYEERQQEKQQSRSYGGYSR